MSFLIRWLPPAGIVLMAGLLLYWQLIITEGTYLGQRVVTWLYDLAASRYDAIKGYDDDLEDLFLGAPIAAALVARNSPLVLDIGTGTGRLPVTLLRQSEFKGQIIGIDDSMKMLSIAARKLEAYGKHAYLLHRSAMALPFADGSFDAVIALEMLEFTPDPLMILKEAVRVLAPGGILVTTRRRGPDAFLIPGKTHSTQEFSELLTTLGITETRIEAWQVDYDLVWGSQFGEPSHRSPDGQDITVCPHCGQTGMVIIGDGLLCKNCEKRYRKVDGIIEFS